MIIHKYHVYVHDKAALNTFSQEIVFLDNVYICYPPLGLNRKELVTS